MLRFSFLLLLLRAQSVFVSCQEPLFFTTAYLSAFWLASACRGARSRKLCLQEKGKREGRLLLPLLRPRDCCHACVLSIIGLQDEASVDHSNLDPTGNSKTSTNLQLALCLWKSQQRVNILFFDDECDDDGSKPAQQVAAASLKHDDSNETI